jgi:Bax protein
MASAPTPDAANSIDKTSVQTINPETTAGMQAIFQTLDYDWMQFEEGVPLFILESIPKDINDSVSIVAKKHAFFMGLLPMILLANQEISNERKEILLILDRNRSRVEEIDDQERIIKISKRYGLRGRPLVDHRARAQLLLRVDTIPPSLVLAQAANESAWGTSRFARLGNNLFGEWTFTPGTGIVPVGRPQGETYEVRKFSSIYESIRSYMNNLNRHGAYRKLREIRAELKKVEQPVTGTALAKGLQKYSQRGEEYVQEISAMIRHNKLSRTSVAFLRQKKTEALTSISSSGDGFFSTRNKFIGHHAATRTNP